MSESNRPPLSRGGDEPQLAQVRLRPDRLLSPGGFTLLEATIALMIASLTLGACLPAFLNWNTERKLRAPLDALGTLMQRARNEAMISGTPSQLRFADGVFVYGSEQLTLPPDVRVRALKPGTAAWQVTDQAVVGIQPSGLCDAWRFEFSLNDGSYVRMATDPLTGFFTEEASSIR